MRQEISIRSFGLNCRVSEGRGLGKSDVVPRFGDDNQRVVDSSGVL